MRPIVLEGEESGTVWRPATARGEDLAEAGAARMEYLQVTALGSVFSDTLLMPDLTPVTPV
jgi:hypothetical protein